MRTRSDIAASDPHRKKIVRHCCHTLFGLYLVHWFHLAATILRGEFANEQFKVRGLTNDPREQATARILRAIRRVMSQDIFPRLSMHMI